MKAVLLEHIGLLLISLALVMPTVLALLMPPVMSVQHITSTHSASSQLKKSNDIVRNLDFIHSFEFQKPDEVYMWTSVFIFPLQNALRCEQDFYSVLDELYYK